MGSFEVDYGKQFGFLENLFLCVNNSAINGYAGDSIEKINIDEYGNLEFLSVHEDDKFLTTSVGAVLNDSIVIKQTEKSSKEKLNQLYSWNLDCTQYTYLLFENNEALEDAYQKIKVAKANLCVGDIADKLQIIGISFDDIAQVRVNEKVELNSLNNEDNNSVTLI